MFIAVNGRAWRFFGHPVGQRLREHLDQNQLAVRLVASSVGNLRSVLGLARINRARLDTGVRENIGKNKRCFQVFPGYVRFEVNHGVFLLDPVGLSFGRELPMTFMRNTFGSPIENFPLNQMTEGSTCWLFPYIKWSSRELKPPVGR